MKSRLWAAKVMFGERQETAISSQSRSAKKIKMWSLRQFWNNADFVLSWASKHRAPRHMGICDFSEWVIVGSIPRRQRELLGRDKSRGIGGCTWDSSSSESEKASAISSQSPWPKWWLGSLLRLIAEIGRQWYMTELTLSFLGGLNRVWHVVWSIAEPFFCCP